MVGSVHGSPAPTVWITHAAGEDWADGHLKDVASLSSVSDEASNT